LSKRISGKGELGSKEILDDSNDSTIGGRKLKDMRINNANTLWRLQRFDNANIEGLILATRIIHKNMRSSSVYESWGLGIGLEDKFNS
jgi:hypothetical protein